jgi:alpha-glucosidase
MIDPGVKKEEGYTVYEQGSKGNHWVTDKNGKEFNGKVWPGPCAFPDFTRPATRAWWGTLYKDFMATGIDGIWNDMNEPSVFDGPDGTMPPDNIHRGGGGLYAGNHLRYHNAYGLLMVKASREGILAANPAKRPFVLSRSNILGGQQYAATWTGDNVSTWEHFKMSIPMVLNLGLSGQPFSGPDLGGFGSSRMQIFFQTG